MAKYQPKNLYKGQGQYMTEALFTCLECGACVTYNEQHLHDYFHTEIQELKDKVFRAGLE